MKKILLALLLSLSSCVTRAVDHAADRSEQLIVVAKDKIAELKTETLNEMDQKIQEVVPRVAKEFGKTVDASIDRFINSDLVAFLIVSVVSLLGCVVLGLLYLAIHYVRSRTKNKCHNISSR
jgi:tetrahydromethanopterin S-methyltransferase subunit G